MATRALIGYIENGVLTTTYNHYDGYPENLGKALNNFFNSPTLAKDIANYGYVSYIDPETGEIEAKNQDTPDKLDLNKMNPENAVERVAGLVDSYGADYAYFYSPNSDEWDVVKNNGIRSMVDALEGILFGDFDNTYDEEEMNEETKDIKGHIMMLLDKLESKLGKDKKDNFSTYQESVMRDIKAGGDRLNQYEEFTVDDMEEDYRNYISDKMDLEEMFIRKMKFRAGIIK
jgi:NTP pyrophosphatase (non-canonical NTP hydrolase)